MWLPTTGSRSVQNTAPNGYPYQIFISYTTREPEVKQLKPFVDDLIDYLSAHGVPVPPIYYDGWYLRRGYYERKRLERLLEEAINQSAFTLAFVSPGYLESHWCEFEWRTTYEAHRERSTPALEYSLLPAVWKRLPRLTLIGRSAWMSRQVRTRLRQPAETVDITSPSGLFGQVPEPLSPLAFPTVINVLAKYLAAWNPGYRVDF